MADNTPYHSFNRFDKLESWDYNPDFEKLDERLELRGAAADRPSSAPDGAKYVVDDPNDADHGAVYIYDSGTSTWNKQPVNTDRLNEEWVYISGDDDLKTEIEAASAGENLLVRGSHDLSATIEISAADVTVVGDGAFVAAYTDTDLFSLTADGITFRGFEIDGRKADLNSTQNRTGVAIRANNVTVEDNYLYDHGHGSIAVRGHETGDTSQPVTGNVIRNNRIEDGEVENIALLYADDCIVRDNYSRASADRSAIHIYKVAEENVVKNNICYCGNASNTLGIYIGHPNNEPGTVHDNLIESNVVHDPRSWGIYCAPDVTGNRIDGNKVRYPGDYGIHCNTGAKNNQITNNHIYDNVPDLAIYCKAANVIDGNTVEDGAADKYAIRVDETTDDVRISNNFVYGMRGVLLNGIQNALVTNNRIAAGANGTWGIRETDGSSVTSDWNSVVGNSVRGYSSGAGISLEGGGSNSQAQANLIR